MSICLGGSKCLYDYVDLNVYMSGSIELSVMKEMLTQIRPLTLQEA